MAPGSRIDERTEARREFRQATGLTYENGMPRVSADFLLRAAAVAGQAATILLTWPLWNVRHFSLDPPSPPLLPAFAWMPQWPMGAALLASLVLVIAWPRVGIWLHAALLTLAMLMDQTRMQPECVSFVLLMVGSLEAAGAKLIGRAHLLALWFFAGFHKLFSPGYYAGVMPFLLGPFSAKLPATTYHVMGGAGALFEMSLAVMAIIPHTRRYAAAFGAVMHSVLFLWLAIALRWNSAVWGWNAALAVASCALLLPWRSTLIANWQGAGGWARTAATIVLISPIGYYFGLVDAFLAHCVYSNNVPEARVIVPGSDPPTEVFLANLADELNVGLPPVPRLYEQYFEIVGQPGERLVIDDPRWWAKWRGQQRREILKSDGKPPNR
jgi:hypothetical protein